MPKQDLPELTVLTRSLLRKYSNRNEAISQLCEATHMEWNEAEALVHRVEVDANTVRPVSLRWILLPLAPAAVLLALQLFTQATARDYWNDLLAKFIQVLLVPISLGSLLMIPVQLRKQARQNTEPKLIRREAVSLRLWLVFLLIITLPALLSIGYDLYVGPIQVKGIIEKTYYSHPRVFWEYRHIYVQGTRYTVLDSAWFNTLKVGQEIEFLCSPQTHYAYPLP